MKERIITLLLALTMLLSLSAPAAAEDTTAATMQLSKIEGTVAISKSSGKDIPSRAGMRLYSGYHVSTDAESYAWINLDDAKLVKVDASSEVEVRKSGKKLEVNLISGSIFFEVTKTLSKDETLNVCTSTMVVGVRGTSGWVKTVDRWRVQVCITEGESQCVVSDPVTGELKSTTLESGDMAECVVYPKDQHREKCDILMGKAAVEDIPGFVLTELVGNIPLCDKILEKSGLDVLAELAKTAGGHPSGRNGDAATPEVRGEAARRLNEDETEADQRLEEIRKELDEQAHNISQDGTWDQTPQPALPDNDDDEPAAEAPAETSAAPDAPSTPSVPNTPAPEPPFTITFDVYGGTVDPGSMDTDTDGKLTSLPTPTWQYHTLLGWRTKDGTEVDLDTVFTEDTTIYAHWNWRIDEATKILYIDGYPEESDYIKDSYVAPGEYTNRVPWQKEDIKNVVFGKAITSLTLPADGVYSESDQMFYGCGGLTNITIPDGITSIGQQAFDYCASLSSVTIPNSVTSIGDRAFYNCTRLSSVIIPNRVTSIGYSVFYNCTSLSSVTILNSVTSIGPKAFYNCTSLSSVTIPNSVTSIGQEAFRDSGLTSVTIPDNVTSIGPKAFYNCTSLASVTIGKGVKTMDQGAFQNCSGLTNITISNGVTSIGKSAFQDCDALSKITIPSSVKTIDESAFQGCTTLSSVTLSNGLTSIGSSVFTDCIALTGIVIPDGVRSIGQWAFGGCTALTTIAIPSTVTSIGNTTFSRCDALTDIYFGGTETEFYEKISKAWLPDSATVHGNTYPGP